MSGNYAFTWNNGERSWQPRQGSRSRAALLAALSEVYPGDQSVEADAVLDQLDTLGYRVVER